MRSELDEEELTDEDIDFFDEDEEEEVRVVIPAFKKGFGWSLGFTAGLLFLTLIATVLIYLSVLAGLTSFEEIYSFLGL